MKIPGVTPTLEVVPLRPHVRVSSVDSSWMEGSSFSETRYSTDTIELVAGALEIAGTILSMFETIQDAREPYPRLTEIEDVEADITIIKETLEHMDPRSLVNKERLVMKILDKLKKLKSEVENLKEMGIIRYFLNSEKKVQSLRTRVDSIMHIIHCLNTTQIGEIRGNVEDKNLGEEEEGRTTAHIQVEL